MPKEVSTLTGFIILLVAVTILTGGVFMYEKFNSQQSLSLEQDFKVKGESCLETAVTQADMNICSGQEYEKSNEILSALYIKVRSQLEGKSLNQFLLAQEAWVQYRDENCKVPLILSGGGSGDPTNINICLKQLSDNRIKDIRNLYQGYVWELK